MGLSVSQPLQTLSLGEPRITPSDDILYHRGTGNWKTTRGRFFGQGCRPPPPSHFIAITISTMTSCSRFLMESSSDKSDNMQGACMPPTGRLVFNWAASPESLYKPTVTAASPVDPSSSKKFPSSIPGTRSRIFI